VIVHALCSATLSMSTLCYLELSSSNMAVFEAGTCAQNRQNINVFLKWLVT